MNRTIVFKTLWVVIVIVGVVASVVAVRACPYPLAALAVLTVALLIPGRVQGLYWRSFFRGRRAHINRDFVTAIGEFSEFLERVRRRPGLKRLIWLSWGMYSRDIESMTENNLGACKMELGEWEGAERHLRRALELDPKYAIPHFNLAVLYEIRKDSLASREHLESARGLGYQDSTSDRVIRRGGELLAQIEGRGSSAARA